MKLRLQIFVALVNASSPISNDDIRQAIGKPAMPQCTVTWHLNELADLGVVESSRMHRYNRWSLTDFGQQLGGNLLSTMGDAFERKLAARKAPMPTNAMLRRARDRVPRNIFELALMAAQSTPSHAHPASMQLALFEEGKRH